MITEGEHQGSLVSSKLDKTIGLMNLPGSPLFSIEKPFVLGILISGKWASYGQTLPILGRVDSQRTANRHFRLLTMRANFKEFLIVP